MNTYFEEIAEATTESRLNEIIESAANDDTLTNAEYCMVYEFALSKAVDNN